MASKIPAAPSNVRITNVQSTQLDVNWDHTNDGIQVLTEYRVLYQTAGTTFTKDTANANTKSLTIKGLTANTDYSVTVIGWKNTEIFTDESNPPALVATFSKPTSVTLSPSSSSSIDVTWHAPVISGAGSATIAGYKISWTPPHNSGVKTVSGTATSDQITGLNGNTAYSVTVAAMSSASGAGALSDSKSAATGIAKPTALTTGDSTSSTIQVTWTKSPSAGDAVVITGYELAWTPATGGGSMMATTDGSTPTTISGLNSNTEYTIQVIATSGSGNGDASDAVTGTTVPLQASQPTNSSNPTINSITLQWTPVSGDSPSLKYNVKWNPSGSTGSSTSVVETSTTISGLNASTIYNFTVTAVNYGGRADPSDPAMFSTFPNQTNSPILSRPSTNRTTQINVEWNKPSGGDDIVDYVVDWWLSSSDGSITSSYVVPGVATTAYIIEGLTPGETYDVTVKARNSAGAGQPSPSAKHTTNPDPVKNFTVKQNSNEPDKILDLKWKTPNGTGDNITVTNNNAE
ncbi:fibronectin-like [Clavelina lepadiformis]|uniref:fibronectin-like n=1 Tax=Clavelina lepadiformis TaxID=159417 RepID=UPI004040FBC6